MSYITGEYITGEYITGEYITGEYITGERLQAIADVYIGTKDDFMYNPVIMEQAHKHCLIHEIDEPFSNPPIVFLYTHRLPVFMEKLQYFRNPFTLITHNSDYNLIETDNHVQQILTCPLLKLWWGQNLCFIHPKMRPLPIGLANSMWEHGDLDYYSSTSTEKTNELYFNFNIQTNRTKRQECVDAINMPMLPMVSVKENIRRLATYRWCICPEGNGVDTHRLWEAIYLGCVPIVKRTPFIDTLVHYTGGEINMIILESWNKCNDHKCNDYKCNDYKFKNHIHNIDFVPKWANLAYYRDIIS